MRFSSMNYFVEDVVFVVENDVNVCTPKVSSTEVMPKFDLVVRSTFKGFIENMTEKFN